MQHTCAQVSPSEAEKRSASFRASLPAITAWTEALVGRAGEEECIVTLGGRRRYFKNLKSAQSGIVREVDYVSTAGYSLFKTLMLSTFSTLWSASQRTQV